MDALPGRARLDAPVPAGAPVTARTEVDVCAPPEKRTPDLDAQRAAVNATPAPSLDPLSPEDLARFREQARASPAPAMREPGDDTDVHELDDDAGAAFFRGMAPDAPESPEERGVTEDRGAPALFDLPVLPPFPVDALPDWLARMVSAVAVETETPADLAAMLGLAMLASACARRLEVAPRDGHAEPLNLYVLVALPSGNRKSSVFRRMSAPVESYERDLMAERGPALAGERAKREAEEKRVESLKRRLANTDKPEDRKDLSIELEKAAADLERWRPVATPQLITKDVTSERLEMVLAEQGGRIAVLNEEGGLFDTMAGRYSSRGIPNIEAYLNGHDGGAIRAQRIGRPDVTVFRPALTMGLAVQPDVLRGLGNKPSFRGRGLLARFLYALPTSTVGSRDLGTPTAPAEVLEEYDRRLRRLLSLPDTGDTVRRLVLSDEAREVWLSFARGLEPRRGPCGDLGRLADWAAKLEGAVARIAGLLHAADFPGDPAAVEINAATVARAARIGGYLVEHAKAAFDELGLDPVADRARRVVVWLRAHTRDTFTRRDVLRANAAGVQNAAELEPVLELLHARGIVAPVAPSPPGPAGGRPRASLYVVAPEVFREQPGFVGSVGFVGKE